MAGARQPGSTDPDTQQNLAYWMGRVDATLGKVEASIDALIKKDEGRWLEFDTWRRQVDTRLANVGSRFDEHERRLEDLEKRPISGASGSLTQAGNLPQAGSGNGNGRPKFGSWEWFRDSYLEKGLYIILSLALYKIIELVIQYWANNP